ncbi:hypothetical protein ACFLR4_00725 [Bacteroidota bacterium]
MKSLKLFLLTLSFVTFTFYGCSETTDPEPPTNEEVAQAIAAADDMIGILTSSNAFVAMGQMPELALGSADLNIHMFDNYSNFVKKSPLFRSGNSVDEMNPMLIFMYMFLPRGTYTYDGTQWSYLAQPDDEIVITFPYVDPETSQSHTATLRYYNMQWTENLISISVDLVVDATQVVEITLEVAGSGFLGIIQGLEPQITSISISGFVVDNMGIQYDFSVTLTPTQMVVSTGVSGATPIVVTITGDLMDETSEGPETVTIAHGDLEVHFDHLDVENGDVGYIMHGGFQVATIIAIDGELYLVWNDGTQVPFLSLFPNSAPVGDDLF